MNANSSEQNNETSDKRRVSGSGNNLRILLFYLISIIVVCLTAFNFYLFCWIWSSLSSGTSSSSTATTTSTSSGQPRMDLLSSWNSIKFNGRLSSKRAIEVDLAELLATAAAASSSVNDNVDLTAHQDMLTISSGNSVQVKRQQTSDQDRSAAKKRESLLPPLVELFAKEKRIEFASGLIVRNLAQSSSRKRSLQNEQVLVCKNSSCELRVPIVKLTNPKGVNFNRKSVQTPTIYTKRIHSPTNSLNFLSTNTSLFHSKGGPIEVFALEDITMLSRNSAVSDLLALSQ